MSILLSPFTVGNTELKNRIVISPMCQYSSSDGFANNWHMAHLGARATGGAALVMQEATGVSPEGRITAGDMGFWKDEHIAFVKSIVEFGHSQGAKMDIQLAHAGRKASCQKPSEGDKQFAPTEPGGWQTVSASNMPFKEGQHPPVALDKAGINKVIADFKSAAQRALQAGYDVIEIHAAHGYLIHQFYSPLSNHRTDEYGGSFENRIRLLTEIVTAVKEVWQNRTLFVRISATDWVEGGWSIDDSVALARVLKNLGVHLIDTSSGGNVLTKIPAGPNFQVPFAARIKTEAGIPTGAVGFITTPQQAEEILQQSQADLIFIARESLRNPNFPLYAATVLNDKIKWPPQYERAIPTRGEWK